MLPPRGSILHGFNVIIRPAQFMKNSIIAIVLHLG